MAEVTVMKKAGKTAERVADPAVRKPLGPAQCRAYMRRRLAGEFEGIVSGFVKRAKSGSCPHVKLATELLEPRKRAPRARTGRAVLEKWVEEMERGAS